MKMPAVRGTMGLAVVTKRERMAAVMSMGVRATAMAMRRLAERMAAAVMKMPMGVRATAMAMRRLAERKAAAEMKTVAKMPRREMMQAMVTEAARRRMRAQMGGKDENDGQGDADAGGDENEEGGSGSGLGEQYQDTSYK